MTLCSGGRHEDRYRRPVELGDEAVVQEVEDVALLLAQGVGHRHHALDEAVTAFALGTEAPFAPQN